MKQLLYGSVDSRNNRLVHFWRGGGGRVCHDFGVVIARGGLEKFLDCRGNMCWRIFWAALRRQSVSGYVPVAD